MELENTSIISSRGRKIMPSLRALEHAEYLKGCPVRRARVKKCIIAIPDIYMEIAEIDFTNTFVRSGFELKNHPEFSPFCINYKTHLGQCNNLNDLVTLEKIYKVGF